MRNPLPESYKKRVEQLYDEFKSVMFCTALSIVKDTAQAEDIVHFAFIKIIKHIERIDRLPHNEIKGYVVLIIKNLSIDYIRKRNQEKIVSMENADYPDEGGTSVESIVIVNLELSKVKENLKVMNDKYSLPLILKYSLGFSHAEIAEMLDISAETAKIRCYRGKRMLADAMGREASE